MLRGRGTREERDALVVPVIPGTEFEVRQGKQRSLGRALAIGFCAIAAVAGIAYGTYRLAEGPAKAPAVTATAALPVTTPSASTPTAIPKPSPAALARAAVLRIAAKLPITLDSTALLRRGAAVYAVGGLTRAGKPTDGIWHIDLASGKVRREGTFVEPLTGAGADARGGVLYLAGGWTGEKAASAVLRWVPGTDATLVARLPVALRGARAVFVGPKLYVAKGAKVFAVDVVSGTVTTEASQPTELRDKDSNLDYLIQSQASYH